MYTSFNAIRRQTWLFIGIFLFITLGLLPLCQANLPYTSSEPDPNVLTDDKNEGTVDGDEDKNEETYDDCGACPCACSNASCKSFSWSIPFGHPVNNTSIPSGKLEIHQTELSATIGTPQGLNFNFNLNSQIISNQTVGTTREVVLRRPNGTNIKYVFQQGCNIGYPSEANTGFKSILKITSTGYQRIFGNGSSINYDSQKAISLTTAEGNTVTYDSKDIGIKIKYDDAGNIKRIISQADGVADVVITSTSSYEVRLYNPSDVSGEDIVSDATPHTVWKIDSKNSYLNGDFFQSGSTDQPWYNSDGSYEYGVKCFKNDDYAGRGYSYKHWWNCSNHDYNVVFVGGYNVSAVLGDYYSYNDRDSNRVFSVLYVGPGAEFSSDSKTSLDKILQTSQLVGHGKLSNQTFIPVLAAAYNESSQNNIPGLPGVIYYNNDPLGRANLTFNTISLFPPISLNSIAGKVTFNPFPAIHSKTNHLDVYPLSHFNTSESYDIYFLKVPYPTGAITVTKTVGTSTSTYNWKYYSDFKKWEVTHGDRKNSKMQMGTTNDASMYTVSQTTGVASSDTSYYQKDTYGKFGWGSAETEIDYGGFYGSQGLKTKIGYYTDASQKGRYGHEKYRIFPSGSWKAYDYDSLGRNILYLQSNGDLQFDPTKDVSTYASSAKVVEASYATLDNQDIVDDCDMRPRTEITKINGLVAAKTFHVYKSVGSEKVEILEKAYSGLADYGDSNNQRTTITYYSPQDATSAGRKKSVVFPNGNQQAFTYEFGNYSAAGDPASCSFTANNNGLALRITVVNGTMDNPAGITNKTTKDIRIIDERGNKVLTETYAFDGNSYSRIAWMVKKYDQQHHLIASYRSNGETNELTWNCCHIESEKKIDGSEYTYAYDLQDQLACKIKRGVNGQSDTSTTYAYDSSMRNTQETVSSDGISSSHSKTYDTAGRLTSETDYSGLKTSYSYNNGSRTVTKTFPGGATEVTEKYLDGNIKSITGTAVVGKYYTYGINVDGSTWEKECIGSANSAMYKVTTFDALQRKIKEEIPGVNGVVAVQYFYNAKGQLVKKSQIGQADTLYAYDDLGNLIRTGLDVNANGTLDLASVDRIAETDTVFAQEDGAWWTVTANRVYGTDNSSNATTTNIKKNRLTGFASGQLAETRTADIAGNLTVQTLAVDRTNKTVTKTVTYPYSTVAEQAVTVNGLQTSFRSSTNLTTTFSYDALGRRIGENDPRTGQTVLAYYASGAGKIGKLQSVTDPAGNAVTYDYSATTGDKISVKNALGKYTYFTYDDRGQELRTWGDADYPTEKTYDVVGHVTQLKTFRGGSGWAAANWPADTGTADVTAWNYDAATGVLNSKTFADGNAVSYAYTVDGKLSARTWARQNNGQALTTNYAYSATTGELTGVTYSDGTPALAYTYNRLGKIATVADAVGTRTFAYNALFKESCETISGLYNKVLTRNYSTSGVIGRYTGLNIGDEYGVNYGFDDYGRMNQVANGSDTFSYGYLANSDLVSTITRPGNLSTTFTFETNRNRITAVTNKHNDDVISNYGYVNDALGRRASMARSGTAFSQADSIAYTYNDRSEVTGALSNNISAYDYGYSFDHIGNRLTSRLGNNSNIYTNNNVNQYTVINTPQGTTQSAHDADGNMTSIPLADHSLSTATWNAENRLTSLVLGNTRLVFIYDYQGRRVEKKVYSGSTATGWTLNKTERFVYDDFKLIEKLDGGNSNAVLQKLTWQPSSLGMDVPLAVAAVNSEQATVNYYYLTDANKNIGQLVDASVATVAQYEYSPFGELTVKTGAYADANPFRFSSEYHDDESGLVYYNYRYYSPIIGKWLSRDPIGEAGGLNLYTFLDNSSINRWDNWGLCDCNTWTEWSNAVGGAFMDGLSDGAAGVADALTGGLSAKFRDAYGINDINDDTNYYTGYYSGNFALESISAAMGTAAGNYVSGAVGAAAARSVANEAAVQAANAEKAAADNATNFVGRRGAPLEVNNNTATTIGNREYSGHALDRMQGRGLTPTVVDDIIKTGTPTQGSTLGTTVYTNANGTVVVNSTGKVVTVITK